MYKTIPTLYIYALLIFFSSYSYCGNILVFGDSLSAGYGLQEHEDWPYLLHKQLTETHNQYTVINESISGETTSGGLARLPKLLEKHQPDIIIIELGANDGLRGQSLKSMKNNLNQMIQQAQKVNAKVILVGIYIPPNYGKRYTDAFNRVYIQLQQTHSLPFIPFLLEGVAGIDELMQQDDLHPNAVAQPIIQKTVLKTLKPLLHSNP